MMKVREEGPEFRDPRYLFELDKEEGPIIMTCQLSGSNLEAANPVSNPR